MYKKGISILVMAVGILLFVMELAVLELDGAPGLLLVILSVVMTIVGLVSVCILNRNKKENIELGAGIFEIILDTIVTFFLN